MHLYLSPSRDRIPLIFPLLAKRNWGAQLPYVCRKVSNSSENKTTATIKLRSSSGLQSGYVIRDQNSSNKSINLGMCRITDGKLRVINSASKHGFQEKMIQSWNGSELVKRRENSLMFASKPSSLIILEQTDSCNESINNLPGSVLENQDSNNPDHEELPLLFSLGTKNYEEALDIIVAAREAGNLCQSAATQLRELCYHLQMQDVIQAAAKPCCNRADDIVMRQASSHNETDKHGDFNVPHNIKIETKTVSPQTFPIKSPQTRVNQPPQLVDSSSCVLSGPITDEMTRVLQCVGDNKGKVDELSPGDGPSRDQLYYMHHRLSEEMPRFFEQSHDYGLYSDFVHFDNRIMKVNTRGISAYKATVQSLKYLSTAYLTNSQMEVLRITMETEKHCIQARWRIKGVPLHSYVLRPWSKTHNYRYFDAFSTFYVGNDGLIHSHVLDKVMPSSEGKVVASWPVRLGIMMGLVRPPAFETDIMKAHMKSFLSK